jgi:SNF2 family DNA or RNA helicase
VTDVLAMTRILGASSSAKGFAPPTATTLRLASKRGIVLSSKARRLLDEAEAVRDRAKLAGGMRDAIMQDFPESDAAWPHQRVALHFMRTLNQDAYLLADEPGVGKTLVAMLWARYVVGASRILVITPNGAKLQWRDEIERYANDGLPITIVKGTIAQQTALAKSPEGWVIGHWESLVHAAKGYQHRPFGVVIADEAHYTANRDAIRTRALWKIRSERRLALTAHPYTNRPDEIYSILHWLYPNVYTSFWRFFEQHVSFEPKYFGGYDVTGLRRRKLFAWELSAFTLRRRRREVYATLPPITRIRRAMQLTTKGRREYDKLRKELFVELRAHEGASKILRIPTVLARVTRLRQYLIDPGLLGAREASVKYPEILAILRDVQQPTVVFTMFAEAGKRLQAYLAKHKLRAALLHGGVKVETGERHALKKRFLNGELDALIVTVKAGGVALNLGKYGLMAMLDLPWHPRDYEQSEGRVDRPEEGTGKLVPTTSYRLIVEDSYEEKLEARKLRGKHAMFAEGFTAEDLKELFG